MFGLIISIILFCFIVWGIPLFFLKTPLTPQPSEQGFCSTHFVITTKDTEESIEGIVRSIIWQISNKTDNTFLSTEIFVVDLGSTDHTLPILEKLAREYPFIHPISKTEYIACLNNTE